MLDFRILAHEDRHIESHAVEKLVDDDYGYAKRFLRLLFVALRGVREVRYLSYLYLLVVVI